MSTAVSKMVTVANTSEAFVVIGAPPAKDGASRLRPLEFDTEHEDAAVKEGILDPKERLQRTHQYEADDPRLDVFKRDAGMRALAEQLGMKITGLQAAAA